MRKIQVLVNQIDEEICSAKDYAETALEYKAKGNQNWYTRYKEMANDELKHAMYIHDRAVSEIDELSKVYTPPTEMQEKWDKSHKEYVEKVAWIKQMLSM